jgi:D-beta-D-heptose 7-phosphate kinase / D-beta-D-heptose 1-phosphate adenosyltransferase
MTKLHSIVKTLPSAHILVIGDVMLDVYIYGDVDRISPEAPIPILKVGHKKKMLGGAGNVVNNISKLGASAYLICVTGNDDCAKNVKTILDNLDNVQSEIHKCPNPTTVKNRFIAGNQQILRTDVESDKEVPIEVEALILESAIKAMPTVNAIILSDYKKGMLSNRVCKAIIDHANTLGKPVFVDPKGNDYSMYANATLIKPNHKELKQIFANENITGKEEHYARKLISLYNIQFCLVTLGGEGMLLVSKNNAFRLDGMRKEVYDVSGAGDSVIATLAACFSSNASIEDACLLANIAGGISVSKPGTAPVTYCEMEDELQKHSKILEPAELIKRIFDWRKNGYKIGFTNGCFDLLHAGHIQTIMYAKTHCDKLIVALNTDDSIKSLKGKNRPIINERERAMILSQLEAVSAVVLFENDHLENLIREIAPDVIVKGSDYKKDDVIGNFIELRGGQVLLAPIMSGISTSNIIKKINNVDSESKIEVSMSKI